MERGLELDADHRQAEAVLGPDGGRRRINARGAEVAEERRGVGEDQVVAALGVDDVVAEQAAAFGGLEQAPVKIPSYVSKANPAMVSKNAMQRWYFTPNYECVKVTGDAARDEGPREATAPPAAGKSSLVIDEIIEAYLRKFGANNE